MISIRAADESDVPLILHFIEKKAAFDRTMGNWNGVVENTEHRIRNTMFGGRPYAHALLGFLDGEPRGFALYYFKYSSFRGRPSIWLDDLYVDAEARSRGLGAELMRHLARLADEHEVVELGWTASMQNLGGIRFYAGLGARELERRDNVVYYCAEPSQLAATSITS